MTIISDWTMATVSIRIVEKVRASLVAMVTKPVAKVRVWTVAKARADAVAKARAQWLGLDQ